VPRDARNVFINVPFDDDYAPLFDALVFTTIACGYRVRCALEEDDSGNIRLDKLVRLIRECPRSIHDLSRIELGDNELPRFNMPFELGLALGAKRFGGPSHRNDRIKIMVAEPYRLPAYSLRPRWQRPLRSPLQPRERDPHRAQLFTARAGRRLVGGAREAC